MCLILMIWLKSLFEGFINYSNHQLLNKYWIKVCKGNKHMYQTDKNERTLPDTKLFSLQGTTVFLGLKDIFQ